MVNKENCFDTDKPNETLSFLISGLVAFSENKWMYPYPSTLIRARGLLFGACIEQGKFNFQSISDFLNLLQTPLKDWWPFTKLPDGIDPDIPMLDSQLQISTQMEELLLDLDDLSGNQKFNANELKLVLDNRKIREAVLKVQKHPELEDVKSLFKEVAEDMISHIQKEETILFHIIRYLVDCGKFNERPKINGFKTVKNPIESMEAEHTNAGGAMEKIRNLTNNFTPPADACNTFKLTYKELEDFEKDLHIHVHLENNILFPKAIELEQGLIKNN